jgi:UDP:flavonoid glycosyltransferase YjiC (YdhE family)
MARFLFVPYSVVGHVRPMLAVAAELAGRGERVWVLAGGGFAADSAAAGAVPVRLDAVPDIYVPEHPYGRLGFRYLGGRLRRPLVNERAAKALTRAVKEIRPDLVVVDPMTGWADRVVRRAGVRSVLFSTTFAGTADALAAARRPGARVRPPAWWYRRLPTVRRTARPGRLVMAHAVPGLQPGADSRVALVGPLISGNSDAEPTLTRRIAALGGPALFVSPGTVFARGPRFFRRVVEAFAGSSWTVVLATAHLDPATLGPLPSNVVAARRVPQRFVLTYVDVFLTHGGMNSTLESILAAVPMVFAPRSAEQRFIARQCVQRGVGVLLPGAGRIRAAVESLATDPDVASRLAGWRSQLATMNGARRAAGLLRDAVNGTAPASGMARSLRRLGEPHG